MTDKLCNRCGKTISTAKDGIVEPKEFELGFRKESILLCADCTDEVVKKDKKIKQKYKKKVVKLVNKYFSELLD